MIIQYMNIKYDTYVNSLQGIALAPTEGLFFNMCHYRFQAQQTTFCFLLSPLWHCQSALQCSVTAVTATKTASQVHVAPRIS